MSKAKHLLLAERISHERELRQAERAAFEHEREMRVVWDKHERELRTQNEESVDKARSSHDEVIGMRLENLNHAAERMDRQSSTFMPIDRFEREHAVLVERIDRGFERMDEKMQVQEKVTVRQDTTDAVLANLATNRRWLYGIMVGLFSTFFLVALHILGVVK